MATKLGEKNGVTVERFAVRGVVMVQLTGPNGFAEYPLDELVRLLREKAWKGDAVKCCEHTCLSKV